MFSRLCLTAWLTGCVPYFRRCGLVAVVVVVVFLLPGGLSVLADQSEDDARVLAELNDDDYRVRQTATQRLLLDKTLTQDDIARLFVATQTPEQRHRLLGVSQHHVIREMIHEQFEGQTGPGSMGLSHRIIRVSELGEAERTGVMVVLTMPGFPAYALLEPGDVIVALSGQPLRDKIKVPAQFTELIREYKAHDTIDMTILRGGKPMSLMFEMEFGEALKSVYDDNGMLVKPPYLEKWLSAREKLLALLPQPTAPDQTPDPAEEQTPGARDVQASDAQASE